MRTSPAVPVGVPVAWKTRAACRGTDPNLFFPERGESADEAKAVCRGCAVQGVCREAGLWEAFGIWGGLSERQRRRLRREQAGAA